MPSRLRIALCLLSLTLATSGAWASATISLGRDPEPPFCLENPGGVLVVAWEIEHTTTPSFVSFRIEDPSRTIVLESADMPGSEGVVGVRYWRVPAAMADGKYWVTLEYWSVEADNEATAQVTFYVCADTSSVPTEEITWGRIKARYR